MIEGLPPMDEQTRQALITEIGTLVVANAELATINKILVAELDKAKENIKRLTALIEVVERPAEIGLRGVSHLPPCASTARGDLGGVPRAVILTRD